MKIAVVIPTLNVRRNYLARCLRGYEERHNTEHKVVPIVLWEEWSGGIAWQKGTEEADRLGADYLHLTNDDIVPGYGYLEPMIASVERGEVPVVVVVTPEPSVLDEDGMPLPGNPITEHSSHFEGHPKVQLLGTHANGDSEYPSLPFCSMEQWKTIGPMIPTHYATDKWFGHRARRAGFPNACVESCFYHYAAFVGRDLRVPDWLGQDRLAFDQNIAYPEYVAGRLAPDQLHPEAKTITGRDRARAWYKQHVGQTYWES